MQVKNISKISIIIREISIRHHHLSGTTFFRSVLDTNTYTNWLLRWQRHAKAAQTVKICDNSISFYDKIHLYLFFKCVSLKALS